MSASKIPHWDLTNVYPSLESKAFENAVEQVKTQVKLWPYNPI